MSNSLQEFRKSREPNSRNSIYIHNFRRCISSYITFACNKQTLLWNLITCKLECTDHYGVCSVYARSMKCAECRLAEFRFAEYCTIRCSYVFQLPPPTSFPLLCSGIGQAMARNPLPLLIPCHRVVPASHAGSGECFGNYSRGRLNRVKPFLIALERLRLKWSFRRSLLIVYLYFSTDRSSILKWSSFTLNLGFFKIIRETFLWDRLNPKNCLNFYAFEISFLVSFYR